MSTDCSSIQNVALQQLADMDPDDILAKQVEQLEKEKRELQEKLKSQEKKVSNAVCHCYMSHAFVHSLTQR